MQDAGFFSTWAMDSVNDRFIVREGIVSRLLRSSSRPSLLHERNDNAMCTAAPEEVKMLVSAKLPPTLLIQVPPKEESRR